MIPFCPKIVTWLVVGIIISTVGKGCLAFIVAVHKVDTRNNDTTVNSLQTNIEIGRWKSNAVDNGCLRLAELHHILVTVGIH